MRTVHGTLTIRRGIIDKRSQMEYNTFVQMILSDTKIFLELLDYLTHNNITKCPMNKDLFAT